MARIGRREILFSLNTCLAALLALYIAFAVGLGRPFWAMLTVYIVSQPLSGAVRSKAIYRLLGTAIGGAMTVLLVPAFVDEPAMLSLVLALWIGLCLFISLLDRTPRSYLFMLAGYTTALIGFPSVDNAGAVFDTAVLRVQEIGLGIVCATLTHSLIFPKSVMGAINARLGKTLDDMGRWLADIVTPSGAGTILADHHRLAVDFTDIHILSSHLAFDTTSLPPARGALAVLEGRLVLLLPLLSSIEDRAQEIRRLAAMPAAVEALLADVLVWFRSTPPVPDDVATGISARCHQIAQTIGTEQWSDLLVHNLLGRIDELVGIMTGVHALSAHIADPEAIDAPALEGEDKVRRYLHRDVGMAALSGLTTAFAVLLCCFVWIISAWPEGSIAAMIAAVVCCFFSAFDDPRPGQWSFLVWTAVSIPLAALYAFAILPQVTTFETLALALSPALLVLGVCMAVPAWYGRAMPVAIGFLGALALNNTYSPDFGTFVNSNVAQLVGGGAAFAATGLVRSIGAEASVRRFMTTIWRDLADIAAGTRTPGIGRWTSLNVDRLGLVASRVAQLPPGHALAAIDGLRGLRRGVNILHLRAAERLAQPGDAILLSVVLNGVADYYRALSQGDNSPPSQALARDIDTALQHLSGQEPGTPLMLARNILVGLRRNLFPQDVPARR